LIRAVVSDFGGVLTNPLIQAFVAYQEETGVDFTRMGRAMHAIHERTGEHPLFELERGRLTEDEFNAAVEAELGGDVSLATFRDRWFANLHPNEPMVDYMRDLRRRGLRMAILTNNVREWEPLWRAKVPELDQIFELTVDSGFVGMRKPEPGIYELTLRRLSEAAGGEPLDPGEALLVDDVDVNCAAARELGWHAVHYVGAEQAITAIEDLLREHGTP
jgi:epoxide hydrolase-like predicted phosphatase